MYVKIQLFNFKKFTRYFFQALCLTVVLGLLPGYTNAERKQALSYNVIAVCLDTLRADHVGCYGYSRDTTPFIDSFAKMGIMFEQAFAQSSFTLPSLASLFTSRYVHDHKADRIERRLAEGAVTLAGVLKNNGYKTAAFIYNAPQLNPIYGLNQGFDTYVFGEETDRRPSFERTLPQALQWIELHKNGTFFVFLHSNDIHEPYNSPSEDFFDQGYQGRLDNQRFSSDGLFSKDIAALTPRELKHIVAHYDGGIRYTDGFIGKLLQQLRQWNLLDKTIIILFSDHGEILADRGIRFCHGFSLHDEEVRVPLIIAHPGMGKGVRIQSQVQLIDVMPTVFDFLGIDKDAVKMEGKSLVDLIMGVQKGELNPYVYAECISGESEREEVINFQTMVRSYQWKFISSVWRKKPGMKGIAPKTIILHNFAAISLPAKDGFELYELKKDYGERHNLTGRGKRKIERELLKRLLIFSNTLQD